jgi:hypothetical protein
MIAVNADRGKAMARTQRLTSPSQSASASASPSFNRQPTRSGEAEKTSMAGLIERWKKRTRRKSIALISFALVQLTFSAVMLWRIAVKEAAWSNSAIPVAAAFWCLSVSYPMFALFKVTCVPSILNPDDVVPASLLRALPHQVLAVVRSRFPQLAALTFRELLEFDRG